MNFKRVILSVLLALPIPAPAQTHSVTLSYTQPSQPAGETVANTQVYRQDVGELADTISPAATSYTDSTVTPGTYQYYMTNRDTTGILSPPSNMVTAVVPLQGGFTPIRVGSGNTSPYTDTLGNVWSADTGYSPSPGNADRVAVAISGTPDPALYQYERWGAFSYSFTAPTGSYTVTLKFAETSFSGPNQRVFNVTINGTTVLSNFDIYVAAGNASSTAIDKSFTVSSSGTITIGFVVGTHDQPKVDAIQIVANSTDTPPSITTQPANQTVTVGSTATFSIVASGTAPLSYQWSKNGTAISGATSSSYTTPATVTADNGSTFTIVVTNSAGSVTSSAAALTVNPAGLAISCTPISGGQNCNITGITTGQHWTITANVGTSTSSSGTE